MQRWLNAGTKSPRLAATRKQFGMQMEMNHRIILVDFQSLLQRKRTRAILRHVKVMVKVKMITDEEEALDVWAKKLKKKSASSQVHVA